MTGKFSPPVLSSHCCTEHMLIAFHQLLPPPLPPKLLLTAQDRPCPKPLALQAVLRLLQVLLCCPRQRDLQI